MGAVVRIQDHHVGAGLVEHTSEIHAHAHARHDEPLAAQRRGGSRADRGDIFDDEHAIGHRSILHKHGTRIRPFSEIPSRPGVDLEL